MGQALQIPKCELNAAKNNKAHHTDEMSTRELIVRRGQDFTIILHFKSEVKQYLKNLRKFFLIAQTGPTPSKLNGTKNEFIISNLGNKKSWSAAVRERDLYSWTISVTTPASAVIGRYTFLLRLHTKFQHSVHKLGDFILLFNPWCPEDRVFLPNEAQRQEYVLSEDGIIYWGTESSIECYPWNFGQGDKAIIDICLQLLDVNSQGLKETNKGRAAWNDPVHLCRMLNCNDEKGILYGSWNGEYSGGTPPGKWKGSAPILHQWLSTNCQPVRYGQCWVFAAVMCTVLRCLGIPTRVVTNFTSAHDTGRKLTVDEYYNENGIKIKRNKNGSIWNFHVWNECWMAREDLPPGYDGWQALDATPQEKSEGIFCCGPAPVRAIKEGDLDLNYDAAFFFTEVNADCVVWILHSSGELERATSNTKYTGNNISTKGISSDRCEDITQNYKYPEGSFQETEVFQKALEKINEHVQSQEEDTTANIPRSLAQLVPPLLLSIQPESSLSFGQDATIAVSIHNRTAAGKELQLTVGVQTLQYNGISHVPLWNEKFCFSLQTNEEKTITTRLFYSQYEKALTETNVLRVTALLQEKHMGIPMFTEQDMRVCRPQLSIQMDEKAQQYDPITARICFTNPLAESLEDCVLTAAGKGLIHGERTYRLGTIEAGGNLMHPVEFTPTQTGLRRLSVDMNCSKFQDLKSYKSLEVLAAEPNT
ncbi:erythrocyte membrane protein band 4.2-like isoform X2 [Rhinatrema bivittatum]|uniref:erythrocyte membrane protein band 4.2-like isoform X2 n=1 Tax=Rhinatrema bivittatum TaxID=194408 RepID=UPI0011288D7E|nr:erythrocyte membrane protein band 4.2-like isoform X2 [Rhinatrema bivittatum]